MSLAEHNQGYVMYLFKINIHSHLHYLRRNLH